MDIFSANKEIEHDKDFSKVFDNMLNPVIDKCLEERNLKITLIIPIDIAFKEGFISESEIKIREGKGDEIVKFSNLKIDGHTYDKGRQVRIIEKIKKGEFLKWISRKKNWKN